MAVERLALLVSLAINLITLSFFVLQTRYLAGQTTSLTPEPGVHRLPQAGRRPQRGEPAPVPGRQGGRRLQGARLHQGVARGQPGPVDREDRAGLADPQPLRGGPGRLPARGHPGGGVGRLDGRLEQDLQIPFIRDVWDQDVSNFDYTKGFKELVNRLL